MIGNVARMTRIADPAGIPLDAPSAPLAHRWRECELTVAVRRHANWAEHAPFALLLMGLLELNGGNAMLLNGLCIALLIARVAHPFGVRVDKVNTPARIAGAALTGVATIVAAIALILEIV